MLSSWVANLVCIGFTILYIIGFYVFRTPGDRNDPAVIRARMKAVTVASFGSLGIVWLFTEDRHKVIQLVGLILPSGDVLKAIVYPLLLTGMLFLGPLSIIYFDQELPFQQHFDFKRDCHSTFCSLLGQRNYVVVRKALIICVYIKKKLRFHRHLSPRNLFLELV